MDNTYLPETIVSSTDFVIHVWGSKYLQMDRDDLR